MFADPAKIIKAILIFLISVFVVVYSYMQIIGRNSEKIETEPALAVTVENTVTATGYIMRNELLIPKSYNGTMLTVADEGERVTKDQVVAKVYTSSNDVETKNRIDEISRKVDILKKSTVDHDYFSSDIEKLDKEIALIITDIRKNKSENKLEDVIRKRDELLIAMNKRQSARTSGSFGSKIAALEGEKNSLSLKLTGNAVGITAPHSGFFFSAIDGYETIFTPDLLDKMTIDSFQQLIRSPNDPSLGHNNCGKIVSDYFWYTLVPLDKKEAANFEAEKYYDVLFPYSYNMTVRMQLYKIISETDKSDCVLIFRTNRMPDHFNYLRSQKINVIKIKYTGLKIPKTAIRILGDLKGVYVLTGSTIVFKRVSLIYEDNDYYIVDMSSEAYPPLSENEASYGILSLYDNVIVRGKDLFHGKVLE